MEGDLLQYKLLTLIDKTTAKSLFSTSNIINLVFKIK